MGRTLTNGDKGTWAGESEWGGGVCVSGWTYPLKFWVMILTGRVAKTMSLRCHTSAWEIWFDMGRGWKKDWDLTRYERYVRRPCALRAFPRYDGDVYQQAHQKKGTSSL